ncbi:unnamed protein product [Dimorphilus gyrociliatus]|uniref:Presenilin n=1 Tax=Dimorphilus gyrociliatus TaxID=2664684 RepID=A0A7I8V5D3_9ANNE|nr:unnamed protein product [Dimorphilus gyrociliatus]
MFGFLSNAMLFAIFEQYNIPCDMVTSTIVSYNLTVVAIVSIHWKSPKILQQSVLILLTAQAALLFVKFMPFYTAWIVLVGLIVWDLIAVLCPKGPLNLLVKMATEREKPLASALIYSTSIFMAERIERPIATTSRVADEYRSSGSVDPKEPKGPKLGLGDFVFYSVLVGIAMKCKSIFVLYACFISIQIGLMTTLFFLNVFKRALPALPISLAFGITMFVLTCNIVEDLGESLSINQIFI